MSERYTNRKRELLHQLKQVTMLKDIFLSLYRTLPETIPDFAVNETALIDCERLRAAVLTAIAEENERLMS